MKKQVQLGLVVEGKSATSDILRLPKINQELGPVKSAALRVARRLCNMLRAGYAVADYEELQAARLILLHIPDTAVSRIVQELCASELVFADIAFVLCESWLPTDVLEPLRQRGSAVATLVKVPSLQNDWFVLEGQASAVRQMRRFLERNERRALEIRPGSKSLLFAAELLMTVLPRANFVAAQQSLRASGLSGNPLAALLEQMAQRMFRDFLKGSRATSTGPLTQCSDETAAAYLATLRGHHPEIARMIDDQLDRPAFRNFTAKRSVSAAD